MGWYDPPDDLPTERVYFEYAGLELDAVLQILAFKDDNLEELVNENLVEEFSIDFTDLYDLEAGIYEEDKAKFYRDKASEILLDSEFILEEVR